MNLYEFAKNIKLPKEAFCEAMAYPFTDEMKKEGMQIVYEETSFWLFVKGIDNRVYFLFAYC